MFHKAKTLLVVYYANMLEYRAEIFLWVLAGSLPIILMGVWVKAAQDGQFALSSTEFARYFFAVFQVRQFTNVWVIWEFEQEVLLGTLSLRLLQPLDPVWHHVSQHLAEKVTRAPLAFILTILFFLLYPQALWVPSLNRIILCVITVVLAFTLNFLIQYTFAMLSFWIEKASAVQEFWFILQIFFSGIIAPLDVFPPNFKEVILWSPFPYLLYFPASILVGLEVNIKQGLGVTMFWLVFCYFLNRWLWKKGLKHYSGMGA